MLYHIFDGCAKNQIAISLHNHIFIMYCSLVYFFLDIFRFAYSRYVFYQKDAGVLEWVEFFNGGNPLFSKLSSRDNIVSGIFATSFVYFQQSSLKITDNINHSFNWFCTFSWLLTITNTTLSLVLCSRDNYNHFIG